MSLTTSICTLGQCRSSFCDGPLDHIAFSSRLLGCRGWCRWCCLGGYLSCSTATHFPIYPLHQAFEFSDLFSTCRFFSWPLKLRDACSAWGHFISLNRFFSRVELTSAHDRYAQGAASSRILLDKDTVDYIFLLLCLNETDRIAIFLLFDLSITNVNKFALLSLLFELEVSIIRIILIDAWVIATIGITLSDCIAFAERFISSSSACIRWVRIALSSRVPFLLLDNCELIRISRSFFNLSIVRNLITHHGDIFSEVCRILEIEASTSQLIALKKLFYEKLTLIWAFWGQNDVFSHYIGVIEATQHGWALRWVKVWEMLFAALIALKRLIVNIMKAVLIHFFRYQWVTAKFGYCNPVVFGSL